MFQWFTVGLFSKYTKNENILLYDGCFPLQEKKKKKKRNYKNLDQSQMELGFWDCFGRVESYLTGV